MTFALSQPEAIGKWRARLGETPVWCDRSASLLWVDILAGKLLRYWPATQRCAIREMPRFTSAVLLTNEDNLLLVVSQQGIGLYDYQREQLIPFCAWPENEINTRPNEAAIAPDGALWFSTMDPQAQQVAGSWYRLTSGQDAPQPMLADQWVPNTMIWHEGEQWFADSLRHCFYRAEASADTLSIRQEYPVEGIPDGSALTEDGRLINARWGAAKLVCYTLGATDMKEECTLPLPVLQPSNCTFGGDTLSDLYITSALDGLARPSELDGAVLKIKTTMTGLPENRFRF